MSLLVVPVLLLVSLSSSLPLSLSIHDSSPLLAFGDQVRQMHLYTESKTRGLFLEIFPNGTVTGTSGITAHTVLELKALSAGRTLIRGVAASLFLCVDRDGQLMAVSEFVDADCSFSELVQPDGFSVFESARHKLPLFLWLSDVPQRRAAQHFHFVPLRVRLSVQTEAAEASRFYSEAVLDSDDPLGFRQNVRNRSPLFHLER